MSDQDLTASLPEALVARLKELDGLPDVQVRPIPALTTPLSQREILDAAYELVPTLDTARLTALAALSPGRPSVASVAWLDFETVLFYTAGSNPFASIGTLLNTPAPFEPFMRLTLANAPAGNGVVVTCRADGIAIGPTFPGFFRVAGPGVAASFEDTGNPTTFTFLVPAGGSGPVEIKIHTDFDRIRLWAFYDCTITQV